MNASQVIVGTLSPDGTLKLSETPRLPPGPVEVLIRTHAPASGNGETWWEYLERGRAELLAQGHVFRSREEIDQDRARQHSADEARRQAIQYLQKPRE